MRFESVCSFYVPIFFSYCFCFARPPAIHDLENVLRSFLLMKLMKHNESRQQVSALKVFTKECYQFWLIFIFVLFLSFSSFVHFWDKIKTMALQMSYNAASLTLLTKFHSKYHSNMMNISFLPLFIEPMEMVWRRN